MQPRAERKEKEEDGEKRNRKRIDKIDEGKEEKARRGKSPNKGVHVEGDAFTCVTLHVDASRLGHRTRPKSGGIVRQRRFVPLFSVLIGWRIVGKYFNRRTDWK